MIIVLSILFITLIILGTVFLRKNTQIADKVGLIFFIISFGIVCIILSPFTSTANDFNFSFPSFTNPFEKIKLKTTESSSEINQTYTSDSEEQDEEEKTYIVGEDIPEGEYLLPEHGNSSMTFTVIDTKTYEEVYSSVTSGSDSFLDLEKGMVLKIQEYCKNKLIPIEEAEDTGRYPKKDGTYFAGATIPPGKYYIKSIDPNLSGVSVTAYHSIYDNMTNNKESSKDGNEIIYFELEEGQGISFSSGKLYPLSDTAHLPKEDKDKSNLTYLGGMTLPSGNYYLKAKSGGSITKDSLSFSPDFHQQTDYNKSDSFFYYVADDDVITFEDIEIGDINSAEQYTASTNNGKFLGGQTIPVGWYKLNAVKQADEASEVIYSDLLRDNSIYFSIYSTDSIYISDLTAIELKNMSLEEFSPKVDDIDLMTWLNDNFENSIATMQKICMDNDTKNIYKKVSTIYFNSYGGINKIAYLSDKKPKTELDDYLQSVLTSIEQKSRLSKVEFYEEGTTFVYTLPSNVTISLTYSLTYDQMKKRELYLSDMPLPNHPDWYFTVSFK